MDTELKNIKDSRLKSQLKFILEADKIKSIFRRTLLIDKSRQENDAEHSWHLALMAMLLKEHCIYNDINLEKAIKMVIVHDMVEIYAGDTFAYDNIGNQSKEQREKESADKLFSILPSDQGQEIRSLWMEFDTEETHDAKFAAALDHFQPFLHNVMTGGHTWKAEGIKVTESQVYNRLKISIEMFPSLKEWALSCISDAKNQGLLY